jgi:hypothetical protein
MALGMYGIHSTSTFVYLFCNGGQFTAVVQQTRFSGALRPGLDTVTLRIAPSDTVTILPENVFILWTGVGLSQFDPSKVGQRDSAGHRT